MSLHPDPPPLVVASPQEADRTRARVLRALGLGPKARKIAGRNRVYRDLAKYSPDQPRDDHGEWTDSGGSADWMSARHDAAASIRHLVQSRLAASHDPAAEAEKAALQKLSDPELFAIRRYTDGEGGFDHAIRHGIALSPDGQAEAHDLYTGIQKMPTYAGPGDLYRGFPIENASELDRYKVGGIVQDLGFTSTTPKETVAANFASKVDFLPGVHGPEQRDVAQGVVFRYEHGTGFQTGHIGGFPDENEVVRMPGSRMRIKSIEPAHYKTNDYGLPITLITVSPVETP